MPYCHGANLTSVELGYIYKIYGEKSWAWWINHIGTLFVCIIGFSGNLLCLFILCRRCESIDVLDHFSRQHSFLFSADSKFLHSIFNCSGHCRHWSHYLRKWVHRWGPKNSPFLLVISALVALDELYQYQHSNKRTLFSHTDFTCKFYYYIRYIFYSMSSW